MLIEREYSLNIPWTFGEHLQLVERSGEVEILMKFREIHSKTSVNARGGTYDDALFVPKRFILWGNPGMGT